MKKIITISVCLIMLLSLTVPIAAARKEIEDFKDAGDVHVDITTSPENKYKVGQWVTAEIDTAAYKSFCSKYFCILSTLDYDSYYLGYYLYDGSSDTVYMAETTTVAEDQIKKVISESNVPDVVKERAKQDIEKYNAGGFTLSGGNLWIIIVGAVVILGGVVAIIIFTKKKKKALKTEN